MAREETVITRAELKALPEYSCSIPTGKTVGKRWRRRTPYRTFGTDRTIDWMIGEYYDIGSDTEIGIKWTWAVEEPGKVHRGEL